MAASLRHPLSGLVWLAMAVIYLPILPAGTMLLAPAFSLTNWQRLLNDPQLPQAAVATLVSTLIATLGAFSLLFSSSAFSGPGNAGDVSQPACRGCWRSPMQRSPPARYCCLPRADCFIRSAPSVRRRLTATAPGWG